METFYPPKNSCFWLLRVRTSKWFFEGNIFNHKTRSPIASIHAKHLQMVKALFLPLYAEWWSRHSNQKQKWIFKTWTDWLWLLWLRLYQHFPGNAHGNYRIAHIQLLREITFDLILDRRLTVLLLFEAFHFLPGSFEWQSRSQMVVSCIHSTQHPQRYNYYLPKCGNHPEQTVLRQTIKKSHRRIL